MHRQIIDHLIAERCEGIQFHISQQARQVERQFMSIASGLAFWAEIADREVVPEVTIEHPHDLQQVCEFISRLTTTAEYQNRNTRPYLAKRVIALFGSMNQDERSKRLLFEVMANGLVSCDDRVISALDDAEIIAQIHEIETSGGGEDELKRQAQRFLLLEMVDQQAREHAKTLRYVDEVEVQLAFRTLLADHFELPIKTRNMIFRKMAQVTDQDIATAKEQIEAACTGQALETFLETWSPWQKFQRASTVIPYEQLRLSEEKTRLNPDVLCVIAHVTPERLFCMKMRYMITAHLFSGTFQKAEAPQTDKKLI